jgi:hypothetical protein
LSCAMYALALTLYCYVTFLGYSALPSVEATEVFLWPIAAVAVSLPIALLVGFNPTKVRNGCCRIVRLRNVGKTYEFEVLLCVVVAVCAENIHGIPRLKQCDTLAHVKYLNPVLHLCRHSSVACHPLQLSTSASRARLLVCTVARQKREWCLSISLLPPSTQNRHTAPACPGLYAVSFAYAK